MVTLEKDSLVFRFPEVHPKAACRITFQRTLRIPDDGREYPLPPGLGSFPMAHVDDLGDKAPKSWRTRGGVFLPMYQSEALWMNFNSLFSPSYPVAIKIAAGKINALTGDPWKEPLASRPQDYLVAPEQPWLDGFCVEKGVVRQFVAMPLGEGYSVEEQLTGEGTHGGIQIEVFPMKKKIFEKLLNRREEYFQMSPNCCVTEEMGLGYGGKIRQELFKDPYGMKAWEQDVRSRCFIHLVNSQQYQEITGHNPPSPPVSAESYSEAGLPWFDYYGGDLVALKGSTKLAGVKSVATIMESKTGKQLPENETVSTGPIITLSKSGVVVREGEF